MASSSNAQDEVLEVVLDKLSELPATMRKLMQIAEKANILTQNKPLVLDYNVLTNALTFSISGVAQPLVQFSAKAEVFWHKNVVGDTKKFFGDHCGAKKAYATADRRRNPDYLKKVNDAAMYIKELRDLLQILNKGRIDASNQFTRSTKMRVQFSCGQNSGEQGSYQKMLHKYRLKFYT